VSKVSRWSTAPPTILSTLVRQVPQKPCWQEYDVCTRARFSAESSVSSAPTRTVSPVDATETVNSVPSTTGGAANRSKCNSTSSLPTSSDRIAVSPAVRDPPHRDAVGVRCCEVSAQRILPHQSAGQVNVDMRARIPARQPFADERQRDDILVVCDDLAVGDCQGDGAVGLGRCRHAPDRTRQPPQPGEGGVGKAQDEVVARTPEDAGRRLPVPVDEPHQ